jgi:hypothetical protein
MPERDVMKADAPNPQEGTADSLDTLVGESMAALLAAGGVVHLGATVLVLVGTRNMTATRRTGLVAASLLVPVIGPLIAVLCTWIPRRRRQNRWHRHP